jgi:hypothetical protein
VFEIEIAQSFPAGVIRGKKRADFGQDDGRKEQRSRLRGGLQCFQPKLSSWFTFEDCQQHRCIDRHRARPRFLFREAAKGVRT